MQHKTIQRLAWAAACMVLAGSFAAPPAQAQVTVPEGYLASGASWVDFVQLVLQEHRVTGSAQEVSAEGQPPGMTTTSQTVPVKGSVQGRRVSISFGGTPAEFGDLSAAGSFTVYAPQPDGFLAPKTFERASVAQFNNAVAALARAVGAANQRAAEEQALHTDEDQVSGDAATVASEIARLRQREQALAADVRAFGPDLLVEAQGLAETHAAEQAVIADVRQHPGDLGSTACDMAGGAADDYAGVPGVGGDVTQVEGDLSATRGTTGQLGSEFSKFALARAKVPWFRPAGAPTRAAEAAAILAAEHDISSAVETTNRYIDEANTTMASAYAYADDAWQTGECGPPDWSAPAAESYIS